MPIMSGPENKNYNLGPAKTYILRGTHGRPYAIKTWPTIRQLKRAPVRGTEGL